MVCSERVNTLCHLLSMSHLSIKENTYVHNNEFELQRLKTEESREWRQEKIRWHGMGTRILDFPTWNLEHCRNDEISTRGVKKCQSIINNLNFFLCISSQLQNGVWVVNSRRSYRWRRASERSCKEDRMKCHRWWCSSILTCPQHLLSAVDHKVG